MIDTSLVTLYFPRAGDEADKALAEFISGSTDQLRIAIYSLNRPVIVEAIKNQHAGGVPIRLITDHLQSFGHEQLVALKELQSAGIPIRTNHHSGLMHLKLVVRSDAFSTGSFNYTNNAETLNDEILAIITNRDQAEKTAAFFDHTWNDQTRFMDWHIPTATEMLFSRQIPEF